MLGLSIGAWLINLAFVIRSTRIHAAIHRASTLRDYCVPQVSLQYACIDPSPFSLSLNCRQISALWDNNIGSCVVDKEAGQVTLDSTLTSISSELFLLFVMLAGLVRERDHCLGRLLFNQVVILFGGFVACELADRSR